LAYSENKSTAHFKFWNNKFYYKVAPGWLFLPIHTAMYGSMNIKFIKAQNLILLMWKIGQVSNNASRWQMGFNLVFKGLSHLKLSRKVSKCATVLD
jgi:hypothetical protein